MFSVALGKHARRSIHACTKGRFVLAAPGTAHPLICPLEINWRALSGLWYTTGHWLASLKTGGTCRTVELPSPKGVKLAVGCAERWWKQLGGLTLGRSLGPLPTALRFSRTGWNVTACVTSFPACNSQLSVSLMPPRSLRKRGDGARRIDEGTFIACKCHPETPRICASATPTSYLPRQRCLVGTLHVTDEQYTCLHGHVSAYKLLKRIKSITQGGTASPTGNY